MAERGVSEQLLYGADDAPGLVGAAQTAQGMRLWWREPTAGTSAASRAEEISFRPFFLLSHPQLLDNFKPNCELVELAGDNYYRHKAVCDDWAHYDAALKHVRAVARANKGDYEFEPHFTAVDELNLYLLDSGRTHFKGMVWEDVRALYFGLRAVASGGADYSDPAVADDVIVLAQLSDGRPGGLRQSFELGSGGEAALIKELLAAITDYDPDVLLGHDIFKGSLNYLAARAKRCKLKLLLGRDGSEMKLRKSRAPAAEKQLEYPRADIAGRSVVDTWFLTMYYDIVKRDLERFDAPYVANYLEPELALPDPLPVWDFEALWQDSSSGHGRLQADLEQELQAASVIAHNLLPSYFAQSQMLPFSLQDSVVRGNGVKINNLLLREYLRRGESIPEPKESIGGYVGGYTELRRTGLIRDVVNVDIASLYPSIMLSYRVRPECDSGEVFNPMLREMTQKRLEAKRLAKSAPSKLERVAADARQAAFKVFINSFYGFLNTNRLNFTDPLQAEFITTTGQKLVKQLAAEIEAAGGSVIEIDTDGVYFTAPGMESTEAREALLERLNAALPEGITAELGGFYPAMLSLKVKNYALLDEQGNVTLKGSGLKSRGLEPFLHSFIGDSVRALLHGKPEHIEQRYEELKERIAKRSLPVSELAKTDTLIDSLESYKSKVNSGSGSGGRNRAAAYEIALKAKRPLRPGDQVSYYITGDKVTVKAFEAAKPLREADPDAPDYNTKYYIKKLDEKRKQVDSFLSESAAAGIST